MGVEYINPQWRLPNEKTGNNQSYSMDFDGSNYIEIDSIGPTISAMTEISISTWIKTTTTTSGYVFFAGKYVDGYLGYFVRNTGILSGVVDLLSGNLSQVESTVAVNDGSWHNIILTFTNSSQEVKIYIDGSFNNSHAGTGTIPTNIIYADIGQRSYNNDFRFNGKIDGVSIFDYALPATGSNSVATLYNSGTPFNPMALSSPPIAYYPLGNAAHMGSNYLTPNGALQDYVFDFDSSNNNYINCGDSDIFSFGNETTDSPFSISAWINMTDATKFRIANKYSSSVGFEYIFTTSAADIIALNLYDESSGGRIGRKYNTPLTSYQGQWIHVVCTYDGTASSSGIKIYLNSSRVDDSSNDVSPYTAMENTTQPFLIGQQDGTYANGKISNTAIFNTELISSEVTTLYNYGSPIQTLANIPQNSNLKAWYKLDASEIYNSTSTEWSVDNNKYPSAYPSSLNFVSASSNYISLNSDFGLSGAAASTFSMWVNFTDLTNAGLILNSGGDNSGSDGLFIYSNTLYFMVNNNVSATISSFSSVVSTGKWYHICGVFSGGNYLKIYLNGVDTASTSTAQSTMSTSITNFVIANNHWYGYFNGSISNVSIWNTALTLAQVTEIYNNGTPSSLSSHSATSNLVSWYKLNNTTTGIQDSKGSNNGTNNGAAEYPGFVNTLAGDSSGMTQANLVTSDLLTTSSYSPYALAFDGNDYINCGNDSSLALTSNFSVSAWMKSSSQNSYAVAVAKSSGNNGFSLQMRKNGNRFAFNINDSTDAYAWKQAFYDGINPIDDGKWHHVVGTFDGSTIKIYVDNIKGTDASSGTMTANTGDFTIARQITSNALYFNGQISNVSYWNTVLTASQVREIYNEGLPSNLNTFSGTAPVAWWQLGSNSSFASNWTVLDEIGTNDGTSASMLENAIVDGVGTSSNGTSTNMGTATNISGSSPNGEGNSLSVNMTLANIAGGVN